ncbi:unnamed protein product [Rhizoctonia solani]|uniref:Uncharacterized protein n=1 Tax=Rhizoctonia solani TaxID=456999 RepID=A0A8H2XAJ2_9AGAM|nr:unnamed protein product [Rhizoctonia solani]CAE6421253.1 unnamed protein product [Rhizoctonia solani]
MTFNLNLTFGAAYIGVILTSFVYGISTLQTYTYLLERRRDSTTQRLFVVLLWCLDTAKLICICHMEYYYGIRNHGNPSALAISTWSFNMQLGITPIIMFLVQGWVKADFFCEEYLMIISLTTSATLPSGHGALPDK